MIFLTFIYPRGFPSPMDIERILFLIGYDRNMSPEEVRDSYINDIFDLDLESETGMVSSLFPLTEDYVLDHLPEGYSIEVEAEISDDYAPVEVYIEKTLVKDFKLMANDVSVEHKNSLKVELATLDANDGFDDEFRTIGEILEKIKAAYDQIERYQAEHVDKKGPYMTGDLVRVGRDVTTGFHNHAEAYDRGDFVDGIVIGVSSTSTDPEGLVVYEMVTPTHGFIDEHTSICKYAMSHSEPVPGDQKENKDRIIKGLIEKGYESVLKDRNLMPDVEET